MTDKILMLISGLMFWVFIIGTISNWLRLFRGLMKYPKKSGIPFVFGILGALALLIAPSQSELARWHSFWWMPFIVDVGSIPWLIYFVLFKVKNHKQ